MGKLKTILFILGGIIAACCASVLFFVPFPEEVEGSAEEFLCKWEDGTSTKEDSLFGLKILGVEREKIFLERDAKRGTFETGAEFRRAADVFKAGDLYSLLTFRLGECSKIERLALLLKYGNVCFYATEPLLFDGTAVVPANRTKFDTVVLLSGSPSSGFLKDSGAERVIFGKDFQISASLFVESEVREVEVSSPYEVRDGAIYFSGSFGTRLVAALPETRELSLSCDFIDEGALAPCKKLEKIIFHKKYDMTLAMMFGKTPVPEGIEINEEIF